MRTIQWATQFKRDYRHVKASPRHKNIDALLPAILALLAADKPLPQENKDHPLTGPWKGFRDCHVRSDLVLIYKKIGQGELILTRLGTHSELFG